jgi:hypothetical protein
MEMDSSPGQGLTITLKIPLNSGKETANVQSHTSG